ncbi:MAG: hypothetical protein ACRC50_10595 [Gaiella sp.]
MTKEPRNAESWAKPVSTLTVGEAPAGAPNLVEGKRLLSPVQGFGKMWQKTYKVALTGLETTPQAVVAEWRESFPSFWPKGNDFYPPLTGLEPGEVALIKAAGPGGMKFKTGVMVLYSDDESFTLMTPEGHMFAGWITFSSHVEDDTPVAQVQVLMRAQDPLSEMGLAMGGHRMENRFWEQTLANLAAHLGAPEGEVTTTVTCVDRKRQWSQAKNVRNSVAIRSTLHMLKPGK